MKEIVKERIVVEMYCLLTVSFGRGARIYGMPLVASRFRTKRGDAFSCRGQDSVNGNNITRSALLKITK